MLLPILISELVLVISVIIGVDVTDCVIVAFIVKPAGLVMKSV